MVVERRSLERRKMKGQEKTKNPPNEQTLKKGTRGSRPLSPERRTKRKNNIQSLPGLHLAGRILLPNEDRIRDPRPESFGCQTGAGSHWHAWYKQMKDVRPFEGIITRQVSDELSDQTHFSILSGNAGLKEASNKQRCGLLLRDLTPRSRVALPRGPRICHGTSSTSIKAADQIIQFHHEYIRTWR